MHSPSFEKPAKAAFAVIYIVPAEQTEVPFDEIRESQVSCDHAAELMHSSKSVINFFMIMLFMQR